MSAYNFTEGKNILFDLPQYHPDINFDADGFGRGANSGYYISVVGGLYVSDKNNSQPYLVEINGDMVMDKETGEPIVFSQDNPYILDDPKSTRLNTLNFVWNEDYEKYVLTITIETE